MSEVMLNLNDEMQKLKEEGLSLRQIAVALGISHEAVRKRLKAVNDKDQVSTNPEDQELAASTIENETVSTCSKPRKQRVSRALGDTVNRVSTQKTPSVSLNEGVNLSETASGRLSDCKKRVFQEVRSEVDSLLEEIKQFLESKGIEIYRMQVSQEAYQVNHKGQVIRIYVQRK
jgi:orotate phosphoribosyltransferase-like protein